MAEETKSGLQTKVWVLSAVAGILFTLVNGFFTHVITSTGDKIEQTNTKIEQTNKSINDLQLTVSTQQIQYNYLAERVTKLENRGDKADETHKDINRRIDEVRNLWLEVNTNLGGPGNHK